MKKMIFTLFILSFFSCNSDKKDAPASENNYPAAQNAAGNIPDTTNSINMGNKIDSSSYRDSTNK